MQCTHCRNLLNIVSVSFVGQYGFVDPVAVEFRDAVTANILTLVGRLESLDCAWGVQAVAAYALSTLADHG